MLFGHYTCFLVQVLIVVHTRAFGTPAFGHYTCFLVQVFIVVYTSAFGIPAFGHYTCFLGTSAYCRPYTCVCTHALWTRTLVVGANA
jgi:hypothetical protein